MLWNYLKTPKYEQGQRQKMLCPLPAADRMSILATTMGAAIKLITMKDKNRHRKVCAMTS